MLSLKILSNLTVMSLVSGILISIPVLAADDARYEIVKATEDRVWRLNKQTGEIAVCTLDGEYLFCTTTSAAVDAPQMTYEEWEQKKAQEKRASHQQQKEDRERALAFFDKILELIRSFMQSESGQ